MSKLAPRQSLGQHFLHDPNIIRKIVDAVRASAGDHVVEIGPGEGALTESLLENYPRFTAIEIDKRAVAHLRSRFEGIDVRRQDILDVDWQALATEKGAPIYVIGNLPYNITSQILFGILGAGEIVKEAVLMMQREVAERLVAEPRTKAYGILSVQTQIFADPTLLFNVSPHVFYPKPDVNSAVVRLKLKAAATADTDIEFLRDVVRTAFNQRRKTLRNSLSKWTREQGIDLPQNREKQRAEELSPEEFVDLARYLDGRVQG